MVMRVLALTKMVEPSLPLSHRIRATSRQLPRPMFLLRGTQRNVKRPTARMCRCAIGAEFWALRTETRTVREQNSMTGQLRPRTVWTSARLTVWGVAAMRCGAWAVAGMAAAVAVAPARTTTVRAVAGRIGPMIPCLRGVGRFSLRNGKKKRPTLQKKARATRRRARGAARAQPARRIEAPAGAARGRARARSGRRPAALVRAPGR